MVSPVAATMYVYSAGLLCNIPTLSTWGKCTWLNRCSSSSFHSKKPHDFSRSFGQQKKRRPWFSPSFLTFRTQAFNPCPHFGFGNSCLSPHCQNLHGFSRSQQTKNGLPKFSLLTSLTTFILASLWWVSHTGWIGPFALHIDIAVSYNERSWSGQMDSQLLGFFLLQSLNFTFFVEAVDTGNPCKHSIAVNYGNDTDPAAMFFPFSLLSPYRKVYKQILLNKFSFISAAILFFAPLRRLPKDCQRHCRFLFHSVVIRLSRLLQRSRNTGNNS